MEAAQLSTYFLNLLTNVYAAEDLNGFYRRIICRLPLVCKSGFGLFLEIVYKNDVAYM